MDNLQRKLMQQLHFWSLGNLNQGTDIWGGGQICFIFSHASGMGKGKTWCPRVTSAITSLWKAHLTVIWSTLKDGISLPKYQHAPSPNNAKLEIKFPTHKFWRTYSECSKNPDHPQNDHESIVILYFQSLSTKEYLLFNLFSLWYLYYSEL